MNEQNLNTKNAIEIDDDIEMLILQTKNDIASLEEIFVIIDEIEVPMFDGSKIAMAVYKQIGVLRNILLNLQKSL